MKTLISTIAMALLATSTPGNAQSSEMVMDAENLLHICTTAHPDSVGFCNGFMQAAHDWPISDALRICPPAGTTRTQLAMLYEQEVPTLFAANPEMELETTSALLVARIVMAQAFPCDDD